MFQFMVQVLVRPNYGMHIWMNSRRNVQTVVKTINLAESKSCEVPQPIKKLETIRMPDPCPKPKTESTSTTYQTPKIVAIRICSREDYQRTCAMKFCECKPAPPPLSMKEQICKWTIFGFKIVLVTGVIYWTTTLGVWGDGKQSEDFYVGVRNVLLSSTKMESGVIERLAHFKYQIIDLYNQGVHILMKTIVGVPLMIHNKIMDIINGPEDECEKHNKNKKNNNKDTKNIIE